MNYVQRLQTWLRTKTGKTFTEAALTGCVVSSFCAYLVPHTLGLNMIRGVLQAFRSGTEMEIPPDTAAQAKEALEECHLHQTEKDKVQFFMTSCFQATHAGSTKLKTGAVIGIPMYFKYQRLEDIERTSLRVRFNPEITWSSEAGVALQESLLLSNNAKKFAIAREIYYASQSYIYYMGFIAAAATSLAICTSKVANAKLYLSLRPMKLRLALYTFSCLFSAALFVTLKDSLCVYFNKKTDTMAAQIGRNYLDGGIEYYEKQLQHNRALRLLMGSHGPSAYTSFGNYNTWFRMTDLNPSVRLDHLKEMLPQSSLMGLQ